MSSIENYIQQVSMGNVPGYSAAQNYYEQKKKAVLNNIAINLQNGYQRYASQSIKEIRQTLEKEIINSTNINDSEVQKEAAATHLSKVAAEAAKIAIGLKSDAAFNQAIQTATNQMNDIRQKKGQEWEYANPTKTFVKKIKQAYGAINIENLIKQLPSSASSDKVLQSQLESYAIRVILAELNVIKEKEIYQSSYKNAIAGYFREAAVAEGFVQYFNSLGTNMNQTKMHVLPIGGKNTEIDIVAGLADLTKMSKNIKGQETVNLSALEAELLSGLNSTSLGVQVKSWKLNDIKERKVFPIGARSALGQALRASRAYKYGYSMVANIMFMSNKKRILSALGENNLIFVDGSNKYWMNDFIAYFRSKDMFLQLNMEKQKGGIRRATNEVILYAYTGQKY